MRGVLLFSSLCLAFAPAPPPRPKPDTSAWDLKALQGTWHRVSCTINGRSLAIGRGETTIAVVGRDMKFFFNGRPTTEWVFTINGKMRPSWLDREEVGFPANGLRRGIYRIENNAFTLLSSWGNRPRDYGARDGVMVEVFTRIKP